MRSRKVNKPKKKLCFFFFFFCYPLPSSFHSSSEESSLFRSTECSLFLQHTKCNKQALNIKNLSAKMTWSSSENKATKTRKNSFFKIFLETFFGLSLFSYFLFSPALFLDLNCFFLVPFCGFNYKIFFLFYWFGKKSYLMSICLLICRFPFPAIYSWLIIALKFLFLLFEINKIIK